MLGGKQMRIKLLQVPRPTASPYNQYKSVNKNIKERRKNGNGIPMNLTRRKKR
jgi:hypothetical protein